jgi:hypothetical protein
VSERCLRAHPPGIDGLFRPQDDDGFCLAQRFLGDLIVGLARAQRRIPPDGQALGLEGLGKTPRNRLIVTGIGKKNVRQRRLHERNSRQ